jgi:hypothetical protein
MSVVEPTVPRTLRTSGQYPPGWVDQLIDAIERLPGPTWLPYAVVGAVILGLSHLVEWAEGVVPWGTFDQYQAALAVYAILPLSAVHYLDRVALERLERFKPALGIDEPAVRELGYQLTTMPARPTLVASALGLATMGLYVGADPTFGGHYPNAPISWLLTLLLAVGSIPLGAVFVYHTIRQLRAIARIHGLAKNVNVFQLSPLHAFSGLTVRTAAFILLVSYVSTVTDPTTFTNPTLYLGTAAMVGLAIACFVVPLNGMHERIAVEKNRLQAEVDRRLEAAIAELNRRAAAGDLSDADPANKQLSSLIAARDQVRAIPTWPWDPGTPRALATAVALPIVLWLVFRGLERFLASGPG